MRMSDKEDGSKIKRLNLKDIDEQLSQFSVQENYKWGGPGEPSISESEKVIFILKDRFTIYKNIKLNDSSVIWTSNRIILFGTEVSKSLVASMVSRELEEKRGLDKKLGTLSPPTIKGWDVDHNILKKVEIIKSGALYSTFFFNEEERIYIINDLDYKEVEVLTTFLGPMEDIEVTQDEFRIPFSDILLLCLGGFCLTIIGWILIVLFF